MANVIELPPDNTQSYIQNFIKEMNQSQSDKEANALKTRQLDIEQQTADNTNAFQQGSLGNDTSRTNNAALMARAKSYVDSWSARMAEGDPSVQADAQKVIDGEPELKPYLGAIAISKASAGQQATGNANTAAAAATGRTAAGGTDPNDYALTTKIGPAQAFPTPQMYTQSQAKDLANADNNAGTTPDLSSRNPAPSGNAITDYEARSVDAMPTSAQNQQAQTQITQTGMQQTGETTRQGMQDTAAMDREKYKMNASGAEAGSRDIKQTVSGQKYADISMYSGQQKNILAKHYKDMGVPVVDKADGDALREIDNARLNQQMIAGNFLQRLPKDPTGRILGGALENHLSAFFQTDEYMASVGTLRTAAIQALRATAGSKGLRINEAEIRAAVENDIPKITDTIKVALTKMQIVSKMLDAAENATLGTFNQGGAQGAQVVSPGEAWAAKHKQSATQ